MPRKRLHNKNLPRGVTLEHGSYYYRSLHLGPARKRVNLGRVFNEAMVRHAEIACPKEAVVVKMSDILDRYQREVIPKKASRTQMDNFRHLKNIRYLFGDAEPSDITPVHVYTFRDKLADRSPTQANQHLALLKHILSKAIEWGALNQHPAREVRKVRVLPRDRYVEDWEFELVYGLASERVQVAMDIAVLTGLRRGDILSLERSQAREDGLHIQAAKTKNRRPQKKIITWSDGLRAVIERAKGIRPQVRENILANRYGEAYTSDGFSSVWGKTMDKAMKGGLEERFTFNDLRAKNASDDRDLMTSFERLGHATPEITKRVYRRKPTKVRPLK